MTTTMSAHVHDTDLFQIALLVDQLRHDDVHHRITAVKSLVQIASALGIERSRDELIPFLTESTDDEQDVLVIIAEKLGELTRYVGGREYVYLLLTPLEALILNEQSNVREATIRSMEMCAEYMTNEHFMMYYVPLVIQLAKKDLFIARISATYLLPVGYYKLPETVKMEFISLFLNLCNDPTPLVRRAAAINFPKMVKVINPAQAQTDYIVAFTNFSIHEQESIRIQSIGICIVLSEILPIELKLNKVLPVVLALAKDKAWRVRFTLVSRLHEVLSRLPSAEIPIATVFDYLLSDSEAEVRAAAASNVASMCQYISKDIIYSKLMTSIQRLTIDNSESVRIAIAAGLGNLVTVLGKEETIEFILPMLLSLLRDEVSDVRLNVLTRLDVINQVLGVEILSQSLLPAISNLAVDNKWRVRLAIIEHIPLLLNQMSVAFFGEKLTDMCLNWLTDNVFAVRCAAVENLKLLQSRLGEGWTVSYVAPRIEQLTAHKNYLFRLTGLHAIKVICQTLPVALTEKLLVPKVFHLVKDPVPNVRMNCSKALLSLLQVLPAASTYRKIIMENLNELNTDSDRDVKYSAAQCLKEAALL